MNSKNSIDYQRKVIREYLVKICKMYETGVINHSVDLCSSARSKFNLLLELVVDLGLYSQAEANDLRMTFKKLYEI